MYDAFNTTFPPMGKQEQVGFDSLEEMRKRHWLEYLHGMSKSDLRLELDNAADVSPTVLTVLHILRDDAVNEFRKWLEAYEDFPDDSLTYADYFSYILEILAKRFLREKIAGAIPSKVGLTRSHMQNVASTQNRIPS